MPGDGTSLYQALKVAAKLSPRPGSILLLIDDQSKRGRCKPGWTIASAEEHLKHLEAAEHTAIRYTGEHGVDAGGGLHLCRDDILETDAGAELAMSRRSCRGIDIFYLSFLYVVSCGFVRKILLLAVVKVAVPYVIELLAVFSADRLCIFKQSCM